MPRLPSRLAPRRGGLRRRTGARRKLAHGGGADDAADDPDLARRNLAALVVGARELRAIDLGHDRRAGRRDPRHLRQVRREAKFQGLGEAGRDGHGRLRDAEGLAHGE